MKYVDIDTSYLDVDKWVKSLISLMQSLYISMSVQWSLQTGSGIRFQKG